MRARQTARDPERPWNISAFLAAGLTAVHPYLIVMSALLLSEALLVPLLLLAFWGLAALWTANCGTTGQRVPVAFVVGLAGGLAILTRPCSLFLPIMMAGLLWGQLRAHGLDKARAVQTARLLGVMVLGLVVVMAPWWVRNGRIYGKFVPTASGWGPAFTTG